MISVVIPLYNKAHTIVNTLGSVLGQTFDDFEVIIVNDGSTDNGVEVIQNYTQDSRIRIVEQKNQGVSVARNVGVKESKYNYISFLDGDDYWDEKYLENVFLAIKNYPNAGMYITGRRGGCYVNNKLKLNKEKHSIPTKYFNKISKINYFENPHVYLHTSATTINKKINVDNLIFPVGMKANEDFAFFHSFAFLSKQIIYIGLPLSYYIGNVKGQITQTIGSEEYSYKIDRYNFVHKNYSKNHITDKLYLIFLKYELRHEFLNLLKNQDYQNIYLMLDELDGKITRLFSNFEKKLYRIKNANKIAKFYIILTKLFWRLKGFPRVGKN